MNQTNEIGKDFCLRCHSLKMKSWDELSEDEKFLIKKLPASAEFSLAQRKTHRFCVDCFYEKYSEGETYT